jgi:niacin transporter
MDGGVLLMQSKTNTFNLALTGMLIAVGIVIPLFSPVKIILEPASFTLASHVAIFIAMFISPAMAVAVSLGTTLGFFLAGFPLTVVLRALTHVIFALAGAIYLKKHDNAPIQSVRSSLGFSFVIGVLHAFCEVLVVLPFYLNGSMPQANYEKGFFVSIFLLVGVGSVIHSMVDMCISIWLYKPISSVYDRLGVRAGA